jgi:hypothetical protein
MIEEWAAYADEYFREKWDLAGDLAEIDRAIEAEARASAEKPAALPDDDDYETCPTCMRPMPLPKRGDHDYGLRLTRADQPAQTAEVERLRAALTEFVQWADDGEDDDGIVARARRALDEANRG